MAKVKGYENFDKDITTSVVMNTDMDEYNMFMKKRQIMTRKEDRIKTLEEKLERLEQIIGTINGFSSINNNK